jgi:hypothetical protein
MLYGATLLALYAPVGLCTRAFLEPPAKRSVEVAFRGVDRLDDRSFLQALRAFLWVAVLVRLLPRCTVKLEPCRPCADSGRAAFCVSLRRFRPAHGSRRRFGRPISSALVPSLHCSRRRDRRRWLLLARQHTRSGDRWLAHASWRSSVSLAAFVLLIFSPGRTINHHGTYAVQILATIFAFMVLTLRAPWLALLFIAGQAVTVSADLCVQPAARSRVLAAAG